MKTVSGNLLKTIFLTALCGPCVSAVPAIAADLQLATSGQTNHQIVKPANASGVDSYAAETLADYLKQITGAEFPVVQPGSMNPQKPSLFVGLSEPALTHLGKDPLAGLKDQEHVTRNIGRDIFLYGKGARVDRFAEAEEVFQIFVDADGDGHSACIENPPTLRTLARTVSRLHVTAPSCVVPGEAIRVRAAPLDEDGNWSRFLPGKYTLKPIRDGRHLYDATVTLKNADDEVVDRVHTYFGLRDIGVAEAPAGGYKYITLNGKPIYLRGALHQSFHPDGIYQYPTDKLLRWDYEYAKRIGLNAAKVVMTVDRHGNTSAASIPLALNEIYEDGRLRKGDLVLMEAMGGGFTWGAVLARW